jgi:hypothetical protein
MKISVKLRCGRRIYNRSDPPDLGSYGSRHLTGFHHNGAGDDEQSYGNQ